MRINISTGLLGAKVKRFSPPTFLRNKRYLETESLMLKRQELKVLRIIFNNELKFLFEEKLDISRSRDILIFVSMKSTNFKTCDVVTVAGA